MNSQQLRSVREAMRCNFNLTEVANMLFTSQPGVSRQIRALEDPLRVGIVASIALDAERDRCLGILDAGHLLAVNVTRLGLRKGARSCGCGCCCRQQIGGYLNARTTT
jgi:LysR family cys regulon transcriptional activator